MENNKILTNIKNQMKHILASAENNNSLAVELDDVIEKQQQSTGASEAEFHGQFLQLSQELEKIEAENENLLQYFHEFDNAAAEPMLQAIRHKLNEFGCSLQINRGEQNILLYKFDYGNNRHIIIGAKGTKLTLVEISPEKKNINEIQEFLEDSEDLIGLLASFAESID